MNRSVWYAVGLISIIAGGGGVGLYHYYHYEYRCLSTFTLEFEGPTDMENVISSGKMMMVFYGDLSGSAVYSGIIRKRSLLGVMKTFPVNRSIKFTYSLKNKEILSTTTAAITGMNDMASDRDVYQYVYAGLEKGKVMYGTLFKIDQGHYAIGESLSPRSLCVPQ